MQPWGWPSDCACPTPGMAPCGGSSIFLSATSRQEPGRGVCAQTWAVPVRWQVCGRWLGAAPLGWPRAGGTEVTAHTVGSRADLSSLSHCARPGEVRECLLGRPGAPCSGGVLGPLRVALWSR